MAWARDDDGDEETAEIVDAYLGGAPPLFPLPCVCKGRAGIIWSERKFVLQFPNVAIARVRIGAGGSLRLALVVEPL